MPSLIKVKRPILGQYEGKDRIVYIRNLWEKIIANDEIDLRS